MKMIIKFFKFGAYRRDKNNDCYGFGMAEIVVGAAVISVAIFALAAVLQKSSEVARRNVRHAQASFLLEEGMEAIKSIRDQSWSSYIAPLSTSTIYYLVLENGKWAATTSAPSHIDGFFERSFTAFDVYRDASDDISSAGTLDLGTKKITVSVAGKERNATTTGEVSGYIADFLNN